MIRAVARSGDGFLVPPQDLTGTAMCKWGLLVLLVGVAGCKPVAKTAAPPSPAEVTTVVVQPHDVDLTYVYGGRVTAYRLVEVRARVGGILERRNFVEGARVRAGDVLFQIDPATYQAAVARAAAQVQQQVAQKGKAERDLHRADTLLATQAGTVQAHDDAVSAVALANAQLAAAQADLRTQVLSLSYTTVTAPIGGVTSLQAVPEGSLVGTATDNSLLTRITQTDPVYVAFSFDNDDLAQVRSLAGRDARLTARVVAEGRTLDGRVDFTDSSIDQATGTVRGRALFANAEDRLSPGAFVRIALGGVVLRDALSVPKAAVGQDEAGAFVYVAEHGRSRRADIQIGPGSGEAWVVTGLHPGDAVVTDGLVHVHEGGEVHVLQAQAAK